jgi:hypothetical protein
MAEVKEAPTFVNIKVLKAIIRANFMQFMANGPGGYKPICAWAEKGTGKTTTVKGIVADLEKEFNKKVGFGIQKLASIQPFTLAGYPTPKEMVVNGETILTQTHLIPDFLVKARNFDYYINCFDEFNRARPEVHNVVMGALDGDGINEHQIPKQMFNICLANPQSEKYTNVTDVDDHALVDRCIHINLATSQEETIKYMMNDESIESSIAMFLNEDRARIQKKDDFESVTSTIEPSDRAYAQLGRFLKYLKMTTNDFTLEEKKMTYNAVAKGFLGDNDGFLFMSRYNLMEDVMKPEEIINNWNKTKAKQIESFVMPDEEGKTHIDKISNITDALIYHFDSEVRKVLTKKQLTNVDKYLKIIPHDIKDNFLTKAKFREKEYDFFKGHIENLNQFDEEIEGLPEDTNSGEKLGDLKFR